MNFIHKDSYGERKMYMVYHKRREIA